MFKPSDLKVNYMIPENAVTATMYPIFTWSATHSEKNASQSAYSIKVSHNDSILWDSGFIYSSSNSAVYNGKALPSGAVIDWQIQLKDSAGNTSSAAYSTFKTASFEPFSAKWIESPLEKEHEAQYFKKAFNITKKPLRAVLYYCGLGLSKAYINGYETDNYRMQPVFTNYDKECCYIIAPLDMDNLKIGENSVEIAVGGGWRKNYGSYLNNMSEKRAITFMGNMCLWAELVIYFDDGEKTVISTDESWKCAHGSITYSHLYNGETYNENEKKLYSENAVFSAFKPERLVPQQLEPICVKRELLPVNCYFVNNKQIYDFGENLAGVLHFKIKGCCKNAKFIYRHSEDLSENGDLFCDTLRSAEARDIYIPLDGNCDIDHAPMFTYHGFRYASLEISGEFIGDISVAALNFYTDLDTDGYFVCGNQTANEIYRAVLRTERSNLHSVATDCPQRDERMAWTNDITVRAMAMPYHFNCASMLKKIVSDVTNEQDSEGRLTCTAPFVFGEQPADPICTANTVCAAQYYRMTGDSSVIAKYFDSFKASLTYLKTRAKDGIVDFSYYGDWAGPEDCCYNAVNIGDSDTERLEGYEPGAANSLYIPGEMMSTAIYYMNLKLMIMFSKIIGKNEEEIYNAEAKRVQKAYLERWFDKKTCKIYNGEQGPYAVSLFVGIIPNEFEEKAAKNLADKVIADGVRLKTGSIVTPMLFDMLSKYGYDDIAWKLFTSCDYPSLGNMISLGATTIWERFELKKDCGMNSHNHPMYGACSGWLYKYLAGFNVIEPNRSYSIKPYLPDGLHFFEMRIPIISGSIYIKCEKKNNNTTIAVNVPFGINVTLFCDSKEHNLGNGFSSFTI